jgi:pimeloyl-ACP methyl ester carboxylesterase
MIRRRQLAIAGATLDGATWPEWHTAGWLTVPDQLRRPELQVLVHGGAQDHRYWDWPIEPERYSYVAWSAARGIATLNIDRIGSGLSSRPPGVENTLDAQAHVLSQLIAAAREGIGGIAPFERVVLVSHTMGAVIAGYEAATNEDVDAVVLTGYVPVDAHVGLEERFDAVMLPAVDALPHLRGLVDADYLTTRPPGPELATFWLGGCDPAIVATEQEMKGTITKGELRTTPQAGPIIRSSAVPTLVQIGQHDPLLIDPEQDRDCYDTVRRWAARSPAHFDYDVIAHNGHNLNLHFSAHESFERINRWLDDRAAV